MVPAFPYLLLPQVWSSRNRVRRRERGDLVRGCLFGAIGVLVCAAIFEASFWLTTRALPLSVIRQQLLVKDVKIFLRDVSQWSQLLLLIALVFVYLYNFRVLDLQRIPYMAGFIKNV